MSFDLRIQFLGLAAYVPEGDTRMHVLLPFMKHHTDLNARPSDGHHGGHGGVHAYQDVSSFRDGDDLFVGRSAAAADEKKQDDKDRHYPRVMYDLAYLQANQPELMRHYELVNLEGRVLDLSGLSTGEGFESRLTHELPELEPVSERVSPQLVRELPKGRLAGRVTMAAGALTRYALGASFHLSSISQSTRMAWETEWTIRGIREVDENGAPSLPPLVLQGPDEGNAFVLPRLYPVGQTIHLTIFNAVSTVFPPKGALFRIPIPTESTHHFMAYHGLSKARHQPPRKPVAADLTEVQVRGDVPKPVGPHLPGVICVQVKTRLADA